MDSKTAEFVGRRSLLRPLARDPQRQKLVGLKSVDSRTPMPVGAHISPHSPPAKSSGRLTSRCLSPELGCPIALALLAGGAQRTGERVRVYHLGTEILAEVVRTPFVDPTGARLHR
jgi:sarcosine oxidase, subunit alpha